MSAADMSARRESDDISRQTRSDLPRRSQSTQTDNEITNYDKAPNESFDEAPAESFDEVFLVFYGGDAYLFPKEHLGSIYKFAPSRSGTNEKPTTIQFKASHKWHPMSGGIDTYLQGCCLNHVRSGIGWGDWSNRPYLVVGAYKLDLHSWR